MTSTKWASVFSRMFLNLSGRRADWSKLTPAHRPFSCRISHREVWLLVSFSSGGGLRSPFWVLELGPPEACLRTKREEQRSEAVARSTHSSHPARSMLDLQMEDWESVPTQHSTSPLTLLCLRPCFGTGHVWVFGSQKKKEVLEYP